MIYLIGGVMRSGKSLLRKNLTVHYQVPGISTDILNGALHSSLPNFTAGNDASVIVREHQIKPFLTALIVELQSSKEDFILEGSLILPSFVASFRQTAPIKSCFLGYPRIDPEAKKQQLKNYPNDFEWTEHLPASTIDDLIIRHIATSQQLQADCQKNGYTFFDTSENFLQVLDNAEKYLMSSA